MDRSRFDELTRQFGQHRSRRSLLKALGAGVLGLGGAVVRPGVHDAAAACPAGQVDRRGLGCVCRDTGRPPVNGVCPCPAGQIRCGATCLISDSDPMNCGACGTLCPPERPYCTSGACVACRTTADCLATGPCTVVACQAGSCAVAPGPTAPGNACQLGTTCCDRPCFEEICQFVPTGSGYFCTADAECSSSSCRQIDPAFKACVANGAGGFCRANTDCLSGQCSGTTCT